jgi:hypothetical protein
MDSDHERWKIYAQRFEALIAVAIAAQSLLEFRNQHIDRRAHRRQRQTFDSGDAATGERALKIALLILARRDVLAAGDVLRVLASG